MRDEPAIRAELAHLEVVLSSPEMKQNYAQYAITQGKVAALRWVLNDETPPPVM